MHCVKNIVNFNINYCVCEPVPFFFYSSKFVELMKHNKIPMFIVVLKLLQITDPDCYQLVYNNKSVSIKTTIDSFPNNGLLRITM